MLVETNVRQVREIDIFALVLCVQSLPFVSAVLMALLERSRLNDFASWRAAEARVMAYARRAARAEKSREAA